MLFFQIEFMILAVVVVAFLLAIRNNRSRKLFLLATSYYFYAYWDWRFLGLIIFSTVVDYLVSRGMGRAVRPASRKLLFGVSLICNLGLLGFFKYFNFFLDSLKVLLEPSGLHLGTLDIILPVGISFYTFQTLGYTIDVYRRQLEPCKDFFDFALFVAFFPQLVAGPIVRASVFLPQLDTSRKLTWERTFDGFQQFVFGLFKKCFIADRLAFFVDGVFGNAGIFDGPTTWLAVLSYAVQIYCDFSGYSDMAIGTARIMGYDFPKNFNYPYIARSIVDFWRRWHISLSTWLRDYLYIPLGGNQKGKRRTQINLIVTMLLGGLWHGAAWTFVLWGALHGVALVVNKLLSARFERDGGLRHGPLTGFTGWFLTLLIVLVGWVFFRCTNGGFMQAARMLEKMFAAPDGVAWYYPFAIFAVLLVAITHALQASRLAHWRTLSATKWYTPVILFTMIWLVVVFPARTFTPFVYFQF